MTIIGWLSVYMQLHVTNRTPNTFSTFEINSETVHKDDGGNGTGKTTNDDNKDRSDEAFIYPQFSGMEFSQAAQLIDLCTLDLGLANYPYSVIAAAAIFHTFSK